MADSSLLEGMRRRLAEAAADLAEAESLPPSGQRDVLIEALKRDVERHKRQLAEQEGRV